MALSRSGGAALIPRMRIKAAIFSILGLACLGLLQADVVDMKVENERAQYLLYEPLFLRISITNNSGQDLVFEDPGNGRSWIDFVVTNDSNRAMIKKDHEAKFKNLLIPAGQTKALQINVTPLYNIRETGSFHISAVLQVGGREFVSEGTPVVIVNGQTVWQSKRTVEGNLLTYSLIRFTPSPDGTFLYLRIEDEAENAVYTTERLGEVVSFTDSKTVFDADNNLHILHVNGKGAYRYTRVDWKGNVQEKANFTSVNDSQPQLFTTRDGAVLVQGGRKEDATNQRELLSAAQTLIKKAQEQKLPLSQGAYDPSAVQPSPASTGSTESH